MITLDELIRLALSRHASDIHVTVGIPPVIRVNGALENVGDEVVDDAYADAAAAALADDARMSEFRRDGETDFAVTYSGEIRLRCNVYRQQGHTALALRLLPLRIPTVEDLALPQVIIKQADKPRGLVLITGPTGSGKSSTLAALLDYINHRCRKHIITLEDPIEYVHERDMCVINQREVGLDTGTFALGLRAALRQDPDVILVGEMRDLETMQTAITAAETGHLVFATLHTKGAANTVDRIIDSFPPSQQEQIRAQLADVLECVIAQTLIPATAGGRCAAFEIMVGTNAVRSLIRQNKSFQLVSTIQTSRKQGMILLDDALVELVTAKTVALKDALPAANDPVLVRGKVPQWALAGAQRAIRQAEENA